MIAAHFGSSSLCLKTMILQFFFSSFQTIGAKSHRRSPTKSICWIQTSSKNVSYFEFFFFRENKVQGVRKWNVPFENATVAKLLNILTGTDVF